MTLRFRMRPRLGPLRFNVNERGLRSVSIKIGPFTWNPKRRRMTTNLPGGLYHEADTPDVLPRNRRDGLHHRRSK